MNPEEKDRFEIIESTAKILADRERQNVLQVLLKEIQTHRELQMHSISQKDYFQIFEKESLEEIELTRRKNTDYACDANAFKNFNVIEYLTDGAVTTEEGILTRLADKFTRITHLLTRSEGSHKVKEESVLDTLRDISVYAKILRIYIMTKPKTNRPSPQDGENSEFYRGKQFPFPTEKLD